MMMIIFVEYLLCFGIVNCYKFEVIIFIVVIIEEEVKVLRCLVICLKFWSSVDLGLDFFSYICFKLI